MKRNIKKIIAIILCLSIFLVVGCGWAKDNYKGTGYSEEAYNAFKYLLDKTDDFLDDYCDMEELNETMIKTQEKLDEIDPDDWRLSESLLAFSTSTMSIMKSSKSKIKEYRNKLAKRLHIEER